MDALSPENGLSQASCSIRTEYNTDYQGVITGYPGCVVRNGALTCSHTPVIIRIRTRRATPCISISSCAARNSSTVLGAVSCCPRVCSPSCYGLGTKNGPDTEHLDDGRVRIEREECGYERALSRFEGLPDVLRIPTLSQSNTRFCQPPLAPATS